VKATMELRGGAASLENAESEGAVAELQFG